MKTSCLHLTATARAPVFHCGRVASDRKEDDMTSTLNPVCPLCGLRYATKPMLELHIREDHRPRSGAQPDGLGAGGTRASSPVAGNPSRTVEDVAAVTDARLRPGQVIVPRRVLRALRHANDKLMRASKAVIRPARAPRS
jgi:hypothetical protein